MIINRISKSKSSVTVPCFHPGRAKDLSAPIVRGECIVQWLHIWKIYTVLLLYCGLWFQFSILVVYCPGLISRIRAAILNQSAGSAPTAKMMVTMMTSTSGGLQLNTNSVEHWSKHSSCAHKVFILLKLREEKPFWEVTLGSAYLKLDTFSVTDQDPPLGPVACIYYKHF